MAIHTCLRLCACAHTQTFFDYSYKEVLTTRGAYGPTGMDESAGGWMSQLVDGRKLETAVYHIFL